MKIKCLPILLNIVSKIDLAPIIDSIKQYDVKPTDVKKISEETKIEIGMIILQNILPQLGKFQEDIIPLVAILKNVPEDVAAELDTIEVVKELLENKVMISFFSSALKKKIEQNS